MSRVWQNIGGYTVGSETHPRNIIGCPRCHNTFFMYMIDRYVKCITCSNEITTIWIENPFYMKFD